MKAIVCTKYGPPEVLQLKEVEKPTPRNNEVRIKIFATAVTSSDCLIRGSKVPLRLWLPMRLVIGFTKPRNPILGMVFAGAVESVGIEVTRFQMGNQVYAFNIRCGTYAQYTCLPENSVMAFKPSNVTYEEAAAVPFGGLLALHFLRKSQIQSGHKVLVEAGKIKPLIDRSYPLEHIVEAHRYVEQGHKKGNVVITVKQNDKI